MVFGLKTKFAFDLEIDALERSLREAKICYLGFLQRTIANLIITEDPDLMLRCYQKAWLFERDLNEDPKRFQPEREALSATFANTFCL